MDGMTDNSGVILLASTNRADVLDQVTKPSLFIIYFHPMLFRVFYHHMLPELLTLYKNYGMLSYQLSGLRPHHLSLNATTWDTFCFKPWWDHIYRLHFNGLPLVMYLLSTGWSADKYMFHPKVICEALTWLQICKVWIKLCYSYVTPWHWEFLLGSPQ